MPDQAGRVERTSLNRLHLSLGIALGRAGYLIAVSTKRRALVPWYQETKEATVANDFALMVEPLKWEGVDCRSGTK